MANYEYHSMKPMNFNENMSFADYLKSKNFVHELILSEDNRNAKGSQYILDYKACSDKEWQEHKNWLLNKIKEEFGSDSKEYQKLNNDDSSFRTVFVNLKENELSWTCKYAENNLPAVFLSLAMPDIIFKYEHGDGWNPPTIMYCKNGEPENFDEKCVEENDEEIDKE